MMWPQRIARSTIPSTLENGRNTHAARGADRDQSAFGLIFVEDLCQRGDDARAGRGERVPDCQAAALYIEFGSIDGSKGARQTQLVAAEEWIRPGFQRA